jgi:hypothetical protein
MSRPSHTGLVVLALAPAVGWGAVMLVAPSLDENLCATGAAPHRGHLFGADARWPLGGIAIAGAIVCLAAALTLQRRVRRAELSDGARFAATVGALSTIPLVASLLGSVAWMVWSGPC